MPSFKKMASSDNSVLGNNTLQCHAFLTKFLMGGRALALAAVFPAAALAGSQGCRLFSTNFTGFFF